MDEVIGNLVDVLKERRLYENTLIVFSSDVSTSAIFVAICTMLATHVPMTHITNHLRHPDDTHQNGGLLRMGASNWPYHGEKGDLWEGGTKVPAFVHAPFLKVKGTKWAGYGP